MISISSCRIYQRSTLEIKKRFQNVIFSAFRHHSTVSQEEIARFELTSNKWWDPKGPYQLLHQMNPLRMEFIRNHCQIQFPQKEKSIAFPFETLRMIDVGCGGGLLTESLKRLGADVVGLDASKKNIEIASWHSKFDPELQDHPGSLKYEVGTVENYAVKEAGKFDVVCALEILEHVENPRLFLKSCTELVKPNGLIFISTMNRTPISYGLGIMAAERLLKWVPVGTHTFEKFIRPEELEEEFLRIKSESKSSDGEVKQRWQWRIFEAKGMMYDPIFHKWRFEQECFPLLMQMNYITVAKKFAY